MKSNKKQRKPDNEMELEPKRRSLSEALNELRIYLTRLGGSETRIYNSHKTVLSDFCGVGNSTVTKWLKGSNPAGLPRIKCMCFLEILGYDIKERDSADKIIREFSKLISFEVLDFEEITSDFGYVSTDIFLKVLTGRRSCPTEKKTRMLEMFTENKTKLQGKEEALRRRLSREYRIRFNDDGVSEQPAPLHKKRTSTIGENSLFNITAVILGSEHLLNLIEKSDFERILEKEKLNPNDRMILSKLSAKLSNIVSQSLIEGGLS